MNLCTKIPLSLNWFSLYKVHIEFSSLDVLISTYVRIETIDSFLRKGFYKTSYRVGVI